MESRKEQLGTDFWSVQTRTAWLPSTSAGQATRWFESNVLAYNLKKYHALKIGHSTKKAGSESASAVIFINNREFKTAETLSISGLTVDSKFIFSGHVNSECNNATQRIAVLMRLKNL